MAQLTYLPNLKRLLKAYNLLQSRNPLNEQDVIQYAIWSRFDPRLGELLITHLLQNWQKLNPLLLRKLNNQCKWPQALAVLLDHTHAVLLSQKELFHFFSAMITYEIKIVPFQSYFIGLYKIAGETMKDQAQNSHPLYKRWGFYAADPMWSKTMSVSQITLLKIDERRTILRELLRTKRKITVNDYLKACRHAIHRRQAERDLKSFFKLKESGNTQAKVYSR